MGKGRASAEAAGHREGRAGVLGEQSTMPRRPVAREIVELQDPAGGLDVAHQRSGELAVRQILRAGLGEAPQGLAQATERQVRERPVGARRGRQTARQKDRACRAEPGEVARGAGDSERGVPGHRQTARRESDRRSAQLWPGNAAIVAMGRGEARRLAGHRDRERPEQVAILEHGRPAEQVVVPAQGQGIGGRIEAGGRDRPEIDDLRRTSVACGEHHEAADAEAAHPGLEHTECQRGGDRRVDGVAAGGQDPGANLGRLEVLRRHQPALGPDHGLANRPGLPMGGAHELIPARPCA